MLSASLNKTFPSFTYRPQDIVTSRLILIILQGSLYDIGTFSELMSRGVDIATFLKTEDEPAEETDTNIDVDDMLLVSGQSWNAVKYNRMDV